MTAAVLRERQTRGGSHCGPWTSSVAHVRLQSAGQVSRAERVCRQRRLSPMRILPGFRQMSCSTAERSRPPREGEIPLHQSRTFLRTGDFVCIRGEGHFCPESFMIRSNCSTASRKRAAASLSVISLGTGMPTAKCTEVTLPTAAFAGCFRQVTDSSCDPGTVVR